MSGEAVAVAGVFGILDDKALVLGYLEAPDPPHQLGAARVERGSGEASKAAPHRPLVVHSLNPTTTQEQSVGRKGRESTRVRGITWGPGYQ